MQRSPLSASPALLARLEEIARNRADLARQLEDPAVTSDHRAVRDLSIKKAAIDPVADDFEQHQALQREAQELERVIASGSASGAGADDRELAALAREELPGVRARADELLSRVLSALVNAKDREIASVVLEVRAGVGGDEAGLFAAELLDMYQRFAASRGWRVETIELSADSATGGIRAAVLTVAGDGAWSGLCHEAGTHCVKRVPATETQGRIHTSTATVAVMPEPGEVELTIDPADVDEHITTAQGPGGQNVNKVSTAVRLLHRPTGIEVRMQETKSQQQNRERAWRLLRARLYERELQKRREEESAARLSQIGSGDRSERIRTYRFKDSIAVDHRLNESYPLAGVMGAGKELGELIRALQEHETAQRLAAL